MDQAWVEKQFGCKKVKEPNLITAWELGEKALKTIFILHKSVFSNIFVFLTGGYSINKIGTNFCALL